jgi:hypothetical protein
MADIRLCVQCGSSFTPLREHARFCSASCRVAWNRQDMGDLWIGENALGWSVAAMREVTEQLAEARPRDRAQALEVINEAVWLVTIVDATLVRYRPEAYEGVMRAHPPAERRLIEGTFTGLRFVRNQMGFHVDPVAFIELEEGGSGVDAGRITAWTWRSLPEPALGSLAPRGQAWEMTRYRAYEAQLAGHGIGETFGRPAAFLTLVSGQVTPVTGVSAP